MQIDASKYFVGGPFEYFRRLNSVERTLSACKLPRSRKIVFTDFFLIEFILKTLSKTIFLIYVGKRTVTFSNIYAFTKRFIIL